MNDKINKLKEESKSNFLEDQLVILTKPTLDTFLKEDNSADLIALYTFYYYTAKWQKTNQPYCTDAYCQKGLHWGYDKFIKAKKKLLDFGLIEQIINKKEDGKIEGYYIKVTYIIKKENEPVPSNPCTGKQSTNALSTNNLNALNNDILSKDNKNSSNELLKNNFKKQNKSSKTKNTLSYNDSKDITKYCLDLFYNKYIILHPKTRKNCFYAEDKIYECEKLINYFINGFPTTNYNDLRQFVNKENINKYYDIINNNFNYEKNFKHDFDISMNIYNLNFNPINKETLPTHLKDFLYCSFKEFKSYFLYYAFNPAKEIEIEKQRKDKHPKVTEKYKKFFYGSKELSVEEKNNLISNVSNIFKKYDGIVNREIMYKGKVYIRKEIENGNFKTFMSNFDKFIDLLHIDFLKGIKDNGGLHDGWLYQETCWKIFTDHVKKEYGIDFNEDNKSIIRRCL